MLLDSIETMTAGEKIGQGFSTFIIGFGIVFIVLILLIFIILLMSKIFEAVNKPKKAPAPVAAPVPVAKVDPVPEVVMEPAAEEEDDDEVIAVIAAVVAAMASQEGTRMKIRSFRRVDGRSQWAHAGRVENL